MKYAYFAGHDADLVRVLTFSAATQLQNYPVTADDWSSIADDLERAYKAAVRVANAVAEAEDNAGGPQR